MFGVSILAASCGSLGTDPMSMGMPDNEYGGVDAQQEAGRLGEDASAPLGDARAAETEAAASQEGSAGDAMGLEDGADAQRRGSDASVSDASNDGGERDARALDATLDDARDTAAYEEVSGDGSAEDAAALDAPADLPDRSTADACDGAIDLIGAEDARTQAVDATALEGGAETGDDSGALEPCPDDGRSLIELDRGDWVASAEPVRSAGDDPPANAIDGDESTRWSTGEDQKVGQWFGVDMSRSKRLCRIALESTESPGDSLRDFAVYVGNVPGDSGAPVASGHFDPDAQVDANLVIIRFAVPVTGRYFRIESTGSLAGNWWSIHELRAYRPKADPAN